MSKTASGRKKLFWEEVRWIRSRSRHYRAGSVVLFLLKLILLGLELGGAVICGLLFHYGFIGDPAPILPLGGILAGGICMILGLGGLAGTVSARLMACVRGEIWQETYDRLLMTEWEALRVFRNGELEVRLDRDVWKTASAAALWLPDFAARIGGFIGILFLLFQIDMALLFPVLICYPGSVLLSRRMIRNMQRTRKRLGEAECNMNGFHHESIGRFGMIQAFDMYDVFRLRLTELQKKFKKLFIEAHAEEALYSFLYSLSGIVAAAVCGGWSLYRLYLGKIGPGAFLLSLYLIHLVKEYFTKLMEMSAEAAEAVISAGRLMELEKLPAEAKLDEEWTEFLRMRERDGISLCFEQVDFSYRSGELVLQQVSWEAHPGEWVGIAGGSGEGKTTLIRLMLGMVLPTDGVLKLTHKQGLNLLVSSATRRFLAYVPQENSLFPGTIADNLRLGRPDAEEDELWDALKIACADDFVRELPLGLGTLVGENGLLLSEGQAERLAIARAVVRDAPICLLDEATAAMDPDMERQVLSNLKQVWRNKTCILTSHRVHVLGRCDRVYRIEETGIAPSEEIYDTDDEKWQDVPYRLTELLETFASV